MMNAFCASVSSDAFMRFSSYPSQGFNADSSNRNRGHFGGAVQYADASRSISEGMQFTQIYSHNSTLHLSVLLVLVLRALFVINDTFEYWAHDTISY